ncbi:AAA family ATPase [Granulosicoccus sp.]|nr:AAA family ATPase [Granulosicoccus sp.]MDB4224306.1 AAA family ATPase [Granulosicoccus sp.]
MGEPRLSDEQVAAVTHVTGDAQLAIVAGVAGSGKSTMLSVVRDGYENAGYRVTGVALAGKAADELRRSSGIDSRTLASWLYRKDAGMLELGSKDVLVVDEAGMVHNGTMERVLDAANRAGAKVILVGDSEQLQPIQAGCPFRSLSDAHGVSRIDTVRRQSLGWQRIATQALSRGEGAVGLSAYAKHGHVHKASEASLVPKLVANYLDGDIGSSMILAHRKVDVAMLNAAVRAERLERGDLDLKTSGQIGAMEVAVGDRVVFTKNDSALGVLNGQFGEVTGVQFKGLGVTVQVDDGPLVQVSTADYTDLQHGYASTIHKSQGMTVDRAMLWGSASLDRHLGYVGMSRHREQLDIYQPAEATQVRSLTACLSRTTRAVTVEAAMVEHGLEVVVDPSGRTRLARTYPTAAEVDHATDVMNRVETEVRDGIVEAQNTHERALSEAQAAFAAHQRAEPPDDIRTLLFNKAALEASNAWRNELSTLKYAVVSKKEALDQWTSERRARDFDRKMMDEGIRRRDVDPLTPAGGVERESDGGVRITEQYPFVARKKAMSEAIKAERETQVFFNRKIGWLEQEVSSQQRALDEHHRAKPMHSRFQVLMYQEPAQALKSWNERLPALEAGLREAQEKLATWQHAVEHTDIVKEKCWELFVAGAPTAIGIKEKTLEVEEKRSTRFKALRQYHWVEKVLESTLGQSMQTAYAATREQLVEKFSRESQQTRLPERLQGRVAKQREVKEQARVLARTRSRSRGMGLGR